MANDNIPGAPEIVSNDGNIANFKFDLDILRGHIVEIHKSDSENGVYELIGETREAQVSSYVNGPGSFYLKLRSKRIVDNVLSDFGDATFFNMFIDGAVQRTDIDDSGLSREGTYSAAAGAFTDGEWADIYTEEGIGAMRKLVNLKYNFSEGGGGQSNEKLRLQAKTVEASSYVTLLERDLSTGSNTIDLDQNIQIPRDADIRIQAFADSPDVAATLEIEVSDYYEFSVTPFNS